ncbi:VOC family protein [Robbsia andropogonis]|nr:VOC family protein [Robbsia andropogonis]
MMNSDIGKDCAVEHGFFAPRRLAHANVFVSDYQRASRFYRDVFGFEEVYSQPDNKASFISNGNTYHDFALVDINSRYAKPGQKPDLNHFAFEVESEAALVAGYKAAIASGVSYKSTEDHDVAHSLYQKDPDGNEVEIYADMVADWRSERKGVFSKKKPIWIPGETNIPLDKHYYPVDPEIRSIPDSLVHGRRVTHIALVTRDYATMLAFYTGIVGLRVIAGGGADEYALLAGTHSMGDIVLYRPGLASNLPTHHIGVEVTSLADLDAAATRIADFGAQVIGRFSHPARDVVFVTDPDGLPIQLYVNKAWRPEVIATISPSERPYLV